MQSKKQEQQSAEYIRDFAQAKDGDSVRLPSGAIRTFDTGATRDADDSKYDYEGFLSPLVLECYAAYMHRHRMQADGKLRDSDNWQRGIPLSTYIKSMFRHFFDFWKIHRSVNCPIHDKQDGHIILANEALCAIIFNASGYLHELLKEQPGELLTGVEL